MIWLSINPRQGNPPKYNVKTKIHDKKTCLNTVFYSPPHIPMDSSWTLHGLCITCSKVLIIPSKSCGVPVESQWSHHHLWEPFFDVNSMVMSVSSSEWPYMASPANTEVWNIFGNRKPSIPRSRSKGTSKPTSESSQTHLPLVMTPHWDQCK